MLTIKQRQIKRFKLLLDSKPPAGKKKEQCIQDFLEKYSDMIPTNLVLNHNVLHDFVISKLSINTSYKCDFAYLTKSSDRYRIVLIEIEDSNKKIFTKDQKNIKFSHTFNAAIDQIMAWKLQLKQSDNELLRIISPLFTFDMPQDCPIEYKFQLIIGRSNNKNKSINHKLLFIEKEKHTGINILTYDSLLNWYINDKYNWYKNIVKAVKNGFEIKYMESGNYEFLSKLLPNIIFLTKQQKELLQNWGYQINEWEKGNLLMINGKYPSIESMLENENK